MSLLNRRNVPGPAPLKATWTENELHIQSDLDSEDEIEQEVDFFHRLHEFMGKSSATNQIEGEKMIPQALAVQIILARQQPQAERNPPEEDNDDDTELWDAFEDSVLPECIFREDLPRDGPPEHFGACALHKDCFYRLTEDRDPETSWGHTQHDESEPLFDPRYPNSVGYEWRKGNNSWGRGFDASIFVTDPFFDIYGINSGFPFEEERIEDRPEYYTYL